MHPDETQRSNLGHGVHVCRANEVVSDNNAVRSTKFTTYELPAYQPLGSGTWISPVQSITTIENTQTTTGGFIGSERQPDNISHVNRVRVNLPQHGRHNLQVGELIARQMQEAFASMDIRRDHSGISVTQCYTGSHRPLADVLSPQRMGALLSAMQCADIIPQKAAEVVANATGARHHAHFRTRSYSDQEPPAFAEALKKIRAAQNGHDANDIAMADIADTTYPTVTLLTEEQHAQGNRVSGPEPFLTPSRMMARVHPRIADVPSSDIQR